MKKNGIVSTVLQAPGWPRPVLPVNGIICGG